MVDIESFARFTGTEIALDPEASSRFKAALGFVEAAEASPLIGESGLSKMTELVLVALMDRREFSDDDQHASAISEVRQALQGVPVRVDLGAEGRVELRDGRQDRARRLLDEQIHTAFGSVLSSTDLAAARHHYTKAKRFLEQSTPDFENSCKESVCSMESLVTSLTGASDLPGGIKLAARRGLIPRPLDDMIIKVYAYRGNEPGVGHGQAAPPSVRRAEAELLFDLAAAVGRYLRVALSSGPPTSI